MIVSVLCIDSHRNGSHRPSAAVTGIRPRGWQNRPARRLAVPAARRFGVADHVIHGVHEYDDDPRNEAVLIHVNGELKHRADAVVSVFDAGFVLGDGVWEGLRVHGGHPVFLDQHLDRLYEGAKAIALDIGLGRAGLRDAIYETLRANE